MSKYPISKLFSIIEMLVFRNRRKNKKLEQNTHGDVQHICTMKSFVKYFFLFNYQSENRTLFVFEKNIFGNLFIHLFVLKTF